MDSDFIYILQSIHLFRIVPVSRACVNTQLHIYHKQCQSIKKTKEGITYWQDGSILYYWNIMTNVLSHKQHFKILVNQHVANLTSLHNCSLIYLFR